jgi:Bax protein
MKIWPYYYNFNVCLSFFLLLNFSFGIKNADAIAAIIKIIIKMITIIAFQYLNIYVKRNKFVKSLFLFRTTGCLKLLRKNSFFLIFLAFLFIFSSCETKKTKTYSITYKYLNSVDDIVPITDSLVKPIVYKNVVSLDHLPVDEKKEKFISLLLPAILVTKFKIDNDRKKVKRIHQKFSEGNLVALEDSLFLARQLLEFNADDVYSLDKKMRTHPVSIVLAQAALECGWGTSRFFINANNIFGVESYNIEEDRVKSYIIRNGNYVYLRKYDHISSSIEDYFKTISRVKAYKKFREKRMESEEPKDLLPFLIKYSELGEDYINMLRGMIKANDLEKYDRYSLDPSYFQN